MKMLFATRNPGKLRELQQLMELDGLEIMSLNDFPSLPECEEAGATFAENATAKARMVMEATQLPALADDSGLEVDALGGAPGVHSARYAGPGASDSDRIALLLQNLRGVPEERRTARFRCVVAYADPKNPQDVKLCEGCCEGLIAEKSCGTGGFGYDPVFYVSEIGQTFAEASAEAKNRISHRGQALRQMVDYLRLKFVLG